MLIYSSLLYFHVDAYLNPYEGKRALGWPITFWADCEGLASFGPDPRGIRFGAILVDITVIVTITIVSAKASEYFVRRVSTQVAHLGAKREAGDRSKAEGTRSSSEEQRKQEDGP